MKVLFGTFYKFTMSRTGKVLIEIAHRPCFLCHHPQNSMPEPYSSGDTPQVLSQESPLSLLEPEPPELEDKASPTLYLLLSRRELRLLWGLRSQSLSRRRESPMAAAWLHKRSLQKMRRMHYESAVVENTNPGVSGAEGTLPTGHSFPN